MSDRSKHLSDELILQYIDHELPPALAMGAQEHLSVCPACRNRQSAMEDTSSSLIDLYSSERSSLGADRAASRIRLRARLAKSSKTFFGLRSFVTGHSLRVVVAAALAVAFIAFTFLGGRRTWMSRYAGTTAQAAVLIPNHALTPGAVRPVTLAEVCSSDDSDLDPEVSPATKRAVFEEYGLPENHSRDYQIDYLVNPQLGGTSDLKNLWPEPYSNSRWNARAKDKLERHLHRMVCDRTIDLAVAQREIATDWITAYKKYIGNERS